ncbi:MAG TPA: choice-of-anchor D domain-containing protein, partial [Planctomycetota bacterium]|nr:choice-of-anchor D domain-containing protein [Planctomycetota bacterium]
PLASNSPQTCAVTLHVNAVARIALSPSSLTFTVALGGLNPPSQSVSVQNTGGGTLSWSAAFPTAWLAGSPSSGSLTPGASQSVALSVDATGLPAGTYSGSMSVSSSSAVNSPQSVGVTLIVSQAPLITRTPSSLTFDGPQGGASPASKSLTLSNGGGGTLTWSGSTNAAWLAVSPTSGSLTAGNNQALSVSVNTTGLTEGTYLAAVQITAAGASNSPQGIPVTLNVNALPKIGVSPGTLSFVMSIDQGSSAPAAVSVTNTGSGTLNWTVAGGAAWLGTSPSGGALGALGSQPLLMTAGAGGMAPGHYTATVQISDPAAINSPQTVAVDLTVTDSPLPLHAPAGQCGLLGLELLIPAVAGMLVRRRRVFPC